MTTTLYSQQPPPQQPQQLPDEVTGQLSLWIAAGLGILAVTCVVFLGWAFAEMSNARAAGREPHQLVDRLFTLAVVLMLASSIGGVVSLIYTPI